MSDVFMPRLSDTMTEGAIAQWLKAEGDTIARGDVIAEIETDKAVMDLEAYEAGVLQKILVQPGESVAIGAPIAVIGGGSGSPSSAAASAAAPDAAAAAAPAEDAAPAASTPATAAPNPPAAAPSAPAPASAAPAGKAAKIKATPLVRSLARTNGIDLSTVTGTGPGGRIVRADIEQLLGGAAPAAPAPAAVSAPVPAPAASPVAPAASSAPVATPRDDDERVPLSQIRKVTARRLTESALVPVFQLTTVLDASRLVEVRRDINTRLADSGVKISVNDLIVRATAVALARHPEANASFGGDAILRHKHVNIGVAVALDDGLVVPVVKDADRKSVSTIGAEVKDLAARARAGKLKLDEMTGGTMSVSNLGMFGIDAFTAVINPPEACILAVGATVQEPVVVDGAVEIRPRTRLTLTVDHRVLDGAGAAAFLRTVTDLLAEPLTVLV